MLQSKYFSALSPLLIGTALLAPGWAHAQAPATPTEPAASPDAEPAPKKPAPEKGEGAENKAEEKSASADAKQPADDVSTPTETASAADKTVPAKPAADASPKASEQPAAPDPKAVPKTKASNAQDTAKGAESPAASTSIAPVDTGTTSAPYDGPIYAPFSLAIVVDSVWNTDPGYDYFDTNDVGARIGLAANFDLMEFSGPVVLSAEAGFVFESEEEQDLSGGAIERATAEGPTYFGGLSARYALTPWFSPFVHLTGGVTLLDVELDTATGGDPFVAERTLPFAALSGGLEVSTLPSRLRTQRQLLHSVSVGVRVEGGYIAASAADLALEQEEDEDARIDVTRANLGELARSGPFVRTSLFARF